jgi:predicted ATPase
MIFHFVLIVSSFFFSSLAYSGGISDFLCCFQCDSRANRIILTGAPNGGKTTAINYLDNVNDVFVIHEAATKIILSLKADFPNEDAFKSQLQLPDFQEAIIKRQYEGEKKFKKYGIDATFFLDRSFFDNPVYLVLRNHFFSDAFFKYFKKINFRKYNKKVFFFSPRTEFDKNNRVEKDRTEAVKVGNALREFYEKIGFDIIDVPQNQDHKGMKAFFEKEMTNIDLDERAFNSKEDIVQLKKKILKYFEEKKAIYELSCSLLPEPEPEPEPEPDQGLDQQASTACFVSSCSLKVSLFEENTENIQDSKNGLSHDSHSRNFSSEPLSPVGLDPAKQTSKECFGGYLSYWSDFHTVLIPQQVIRPLSGTMAPHNSDDPASLLREELAQSGLYDQSSLSEVNSEKPEGIKESAQSSLDCQGSFSEINSEKPEGIDEEKKNSCIKLRSDLTQLFDKSQIKSKKKQNNQTRGSSDLNSRNISPSLSPGYSGLMMHSGSVTRNHFSHQSSLKSEKEPQLNESNHSHFSSPLDETLQKYPSLKDGLNENNVKQSSFRLSLPNLDASGPSSSAGVALPTPRHVGKKAFDKAFEKNAASEARKSVEFPKNDSCSEEQRSSLEFNLGSHKKEE